MITCYGWVYWLTVRLSLTLEQSWNFYFAASLEPQQSPRQCCPSVTNRWGWQRVWGILPWAPALPGVSQCFISSFDFAVFYSSLQPGCWKQLPLIMKTGIRAFHKKQWTSFEARSESRVLFYKDTVCHHKGLVNLQLCLAFLNHFHSSGKQMCLVERAFLAPKLVFCTMALLHLRKYWYT